MSKGVGNPPRWRTPVLIRIGNGSSESVRSPSEALHYLFNRWPTERGERYSAAVEARKAASEEAASGEVAREAFIAAASEADVRA